MNIIKQNPNISFKARINFVNSDRMDSLCDIEKLSQNGKVAYGEFQAKDSVIADKTATLNVADCVCFSIMSENDSFMMHIIPDWGNEHFSEIENYIKNIIDRLKNKSALLIGGFEDNDKSSLLQKKFIDLMKKLNIDCSQILSQMNSGIINVYADPQKQEWNVNLQSTAFDRLTLQEKRKKGFYADGNYSPKTKEDIMSHFANVKISDKDTLTIE